MAYTSLYRKYRPASFDKVIGQDHIVKTLKNQIANNAISHAYIFTGTRGTGKTSVAKVFARAVNCTHPLADGSPCGKCENCIELSKPTNFDIIELDAASNNSVDQMRELIEKVNFPPTVGRFKVYIIDEAHMLSKAAFNAMLKTLEEPPSHVIFILATTEIQQVPTTILSRCLRFDFRLVPNKVIAERIKFIFDDCNIKYENEAIDLVANAGNGSVRDALSVADMCVSYCNNFVTYNGVLEVLGAADPKKLYELAVSILDGKTDESLKQISALCDLGKNVQILANDMAVLFRNVLYIKYCSNARELLTLPESLYSQLKSIAEGYSVEKCMSCMKIFSSLDGDMRYSSQHRILFEGAVIRACCGIDSDTKIDEVQLKVARLEKYLASLKKSNFECAPVKLDAKQVWNRVASELDESNRKFLALAATEAMVEEVGDEVIVSVATPSTYEMFVDKKNMDVIRAIFVKYMPDKVLKFKQIVHLDEDKALPFIKEYFGSTLEIK